ncbi:bis(5'-nucleosyl)-tetraphosphatase (symmetrical) YqeK [Pseudogracilibacillus auburnensis]|uniref:bis(5'-nucleosyl)-tetraphosphatase (symmetrical) n=1 Tax=Pseudogracilibacillus auburnensis TaxID=1494959 RepID=A0A2V3VX41_9BACI|nr:bis(5'-nucleosyl)-tetraphosphatase (symmetrical) YqeK [Pseudogracilibacillus auburnensis]MBO1003455.1 bis(5'-nucleosyl)-tetraphosphatase (symmetrical) YqeK [Pseudogracilibacillus auburnensis]PXW86557.1 putative HD superfamily hydrolase involved in NAD metabolism [Pseudogracilibacillus auburnensis]
MKLHKIREEVKKELSNDRYEHTIRVYETAIELATLYDESVEKVSLAALLHDYAKCQTDRELKDNIEKHDLPRQLLHYNKELWHGPVAAMIAKKTFRITDVDTINAIYYHTTGREQMSNVELIVFVSDYIEPGRQFPGVEEVRQLAKVDLKKAARKVLQNTIIFLLKKDATIYPDTFLAYNELTNNLKE